jgi:phosphodiesterase/alkaline phosphatase D-like protein
MKLFWQSILTVVVLSVTRADAVVDDMAASPPVRVVPPTDVVAGPMVCWDATKEYGLSVWFARHGNGPTYVLRNDARNRESKIGETISTSMVCGSAGDGIHAMSMPIGKLEDVSKGDLQVALLRYPTGWNGEKDSNDFFGKATFRRIPLKGESGKFTFAFGSCSHQERFGERQPIWSEIVKEKPDCFFFIGDNIYLPSDPAAFPTEREAVLKFYCDAYDRQRQMPELQPLLRSTYCFGIWDDHDYGPNNSDNTWKWKEVALEAFEANFPGTYGLPDAPGCFQKFSWGDVDVFLLDDRSFRSPNFAPDLGKSMFGAAQLAWLKDGLAKSKGKVKLVVSGNQMLSDKHPYESWGTYFKPERDAFLRWLWDEKIGGVFFLAGDRHFAELIHKRDPMGVGRDVWELTSSPLANAHFDCGGMVKNEERIAKYTGGVNYGLVRVDTTVTPARVELVVKDVSGNVVIEQGVAIDK